MNKDPAPMASGPTKWRAEKCVTHHHACDCREWGHATEIERLRELISKAITDYIEPEIRTEMDAFKGHEHCSNLDGLRADLAEFQDANSQ